MNSLPMEGTSGIGVKMTAGIHTPAKPYERHLWNWLFCFQFEISYLDISMPSMGVGHGIHLECPILPSQEIKNLFLQRFSYTDLKGSTCILTLGNRHNQEKFIFLFTRLLCINMKVTFTDLIRWFTIQVFFILNKNTILNHKLNWNLYMAN